MREYIGKNSRYSVWIDNTHVYLMPRNINARILPVEKQLMNKEYTCYRHTKLIAHRCLYDDLVPCESLPDDFPTVR